MTNLCILVPPLKDYYRVQDVIPVIENECVIGVFNGWAEDSVVRTTVDQYIDEYFCQCTVTAYSPKSGRIKTTVYLLKENGVWNYHRKSYKKLAHILDKLSKNIAYGKAIDNS